MTAMKRTNLEEKTMQSAQLTEVEKKSPIASYFYREMTHPPGDVMSVLKAGPINPDDALPFARINDLLNPGYLKVENGYGVMPDGVHYTAILTKMPKVTGEMINWWFWWMPQEDLRYKIWCPGDHCAHPPVNKDQLIHSKLPMGERFWHNPMSVIEIIDGIPVKITITFVPPKEFGLDTTRFKEANVATAICAYVGSAEINKIAMLHFVRNTDNGVEMRSRFWAGAAIRIKELAEDSLVNQTLNTPELRNELIPPGIEKAFAFHCTKEYNHLATILPELYDKYGST
jgi:hypothetical protein